ncbi:MAG: hypothetical protein GYB56_05400 [Gammaproteobacteria bacterium]|nr:hypothetical protein [Gammaproteobacteria bacterium]
MEIAQHTDVFVTLVVTVEVLAGLVWSRWPAQRLMMAAAVSLILLGINAFALIVLAMAMAILLLAVRLLPLYPHLLTVYIAHGCRLPLQSRSRESQLAWLFSRRDARRRLLAPRCASCRFINKNGTGVCHRSDPAACQPQVNFIAELEAMRTIKNSSLRAYRQYQFLRWDSST